MLVVTFPFLHAPLDDTYEYRFVHRQLGEFWRELGQRFDPTRPGRNESKVLLNHILLRAGPVEMVAYLKQALVAQKGINNREAEAAFLRKLSGRAPGALKELLTAIDSYEAFGRVITCAFDALRHCSSRNGAAPIDASEFAATKSAKVALDALSPSLARVRAHPMLLEWEREQPGLDAALLRFEGVRNGADLFETIVEHHEHVQENKPPNGKRSWFERSPSGKVVVRSGYALDVSPDGPGSYVHEYRIPTFSGFLADLGAYR